MAQRRPKIRETCATKLLRTRWVITVVSPVRVPAAISTAVSSDNPINQRAHTTQLEITILRLGANRINSVAWMSRGQPPLGQHLRVTSPTLASAEIS